MTRKTYITLRGVKTDSVPYGQIPLSHRHQIIEQYLSMGSIFVRERWNISMRTLGHIIFHNKEYVRKIEDRNFRNAGI